MISNILKRYAAPFSFLTFALLHRNNYSACVDATKAATPYSKLKSKLKEIECLSGIRSLVGWDEMVLMKSGSSDARNQQKSSLAAVIYEKETSTELEDLLQSLEQKNDQDDNIITVYDRAVVREARRDYNLSKRKSKEQAMREAELEGEGYQAWVEARSTDNFQKFEPVLQEILTLRKDIAKATRPNLSLYDGNIDIFERGMKSERLNSILNSAKVKLIPLLDKVSKADKKSKYQIPDALKGGKTPVTTYIKHNIIYIDLHSLYIKHKLRIKYENVISSQQN